jgi:2-amino-4-hydroxy-6-hydroxymethyldihydropteridine diphosphokinase
MPCAYLSIGSNLGARARTCLKALQQLDDRGDTRVLERSGLYETEPQLVVEQPDFINLAAALQTELDALALLEVCKGIEESLGRVPGKRWGPRVVDLDLLLVDDLVLETSDLTLPHPRMHERRFVLEPLAEIAPDLVHPIRGCSMSKLLSDLGASGGRVRQI